MKEYIKDYYGKILGWIETSASGDKVAKDYYGRIVGYYEKQRDLTLNYYKHIVARGDCIKGSVLSNSLNSKNNKENN